MRTRAWMLAGVCLLALCFAAPSLSAAEDAYDLRSVKWGMSREEVKKAERSAPVMESDNLIVFNDKIFDKNIQVAYAFVDNKLWKVRYFLVDIHTNKNDYISDYEEFVEALISKYGKPKQSKVLWKNNTYAEDKQNHGLAVSMGHLALFSAWDTAKTTVFCFIDGENFNVNVRIDYESSELRDLAIKQKKDEEKGKL
ncbi:hypothetical protein G3N56_11770 [Desulfovibrio sulfodismutans]|uniref:Uncharacterized protein n=1 Tax=Desulfolutivibrio sulfodismutans TaxID=63561 RepID=A0A7K3NMM1_9BACT|nr:hypothetical protein [Desulfolutivibrio sulfodismutans]NDY57418.1 hypothetical protein [Desulfolutivibrio sulfodismutans]QLA11900.1 hypothetical protein GD606_06305 [Desulfolutivibrio sulfodismutans DSM 3696]